MVLQTWPDHGTPEEADGVLTFVDDINRKMYQIAQSNNAPEQVEWKSQQWAREGHAVET